MSTIKQRKDKTDVSLSAMIDVVFLLLLFFVATYVSERTEAFLSINHPRGPSQPGSAPLEACVEPSGYRFMGRLMPLDNVESQLLEVAVTDSKTPIFIKVNPDALEGQLIDLLDRCKKVNLNNLNVMTLKTTE